MNYIGKLTGYNFLVMLLYIFLLQHLLPNDTHSENFLLIIAIGLTMSLHLVGVFLLSLSLIVAKEYAKGKAWLASTFILLLLAFSTCIGTIKLIG